MLKTIKDIKKKKILFFISFIVLDTFLLLIFGENYSKFVILDNIYLHDLLIFILFLLALPSVLIKANRFISIEILSLIALFYFAYSFWRFKDSIENTNALYYIVRQFMIFGYLIFYYIIIKKITTNKKSTAILIKFIILFSKASVLLQTVYVLFQFIIHNRNPFFKKYYFSPIIILGIIIFAAYVLFHFKGYKKWTFFILTFILSLTIGHDSAYLSIIVLLLTNWFIFNSLKGKVIIIAGFIIMLFILFNKAPTFQDANVEWRLYYWQYGLNKITLENYFILGEGFGTEFFGETQREYLNNIMVKYGHNFHLTKPEKFLIPFHNSFITIMFHLGGVSIILLFYPFIKFLKKSLMLNHSKKIFLFTSLVGLSVFSAFNVTLELPHSSSIYWIVFFTLLNYCNINQENKIIEN